MSYKKPKTINRIDKTIIKKNMGDKYFKKLTGESNNIYNFINYRFRHIHFYLNSESDEEVHENVVDTVKEINDKIDEYNKNKPLNKQFNIIERGNYMPKMTQKNASFFFTLMRDKPIEEFPEKVNAYKEVQAGIAQGVVLDLVMRDWDNYLKSKFAYHKDPSKFKRYPKPPNFKSKGGQTSVFISNNAFTEKDGLITIAKRTVGYTFQKSRPQDKLTQIRIIPKFNHYVLEQVYQYPCDTEIGIKLNNNKKEVCIAIDLGINNLMAVTNNFNEKSFIVNGKVVKSINQHWNKQRSKAMSYIGNRGISNRVASLDLKRNNKIHDIMHKASKYIVDYAKKHKVDTIIIGYNEGWKTNSNLGKKTNQNFTSIPFKKLINNIEYKANEVGVSVILNEESYTSQTDALSLEEIKYQGEAKRVRRGKFISSTGMMINADINGSLNIMRKVIGDDFMEFILKKENKDNLTPVKINVV